MGTTGGVDYALASFLAMVVYIVEEFNGKLDLPQHSDRGGSGKTTVLFEFATAALELAATKGLLLPPPMNSTTSDPTDDEADGMTFRVIRRKPTTSRSAFIKHLEGARSAAASARKKA